MISKEKVPYCTVQYSNDGITMERLCSQYEVESGVRYNADLPRMVVMQAVSHSGFNA